MKWTVKQLESALSKKAADWPPFVLVYGEDGGQAKDYAKKVAQLVAPDLNDPFAVDRMRVEDLLEDSAKLIDSIGMVSFGVGQKLIFIEGVSKDLPATTVAKVTDAVKSALPMLNDGVVVVMAAAGFDNKAALIKHVEKDKQTIAIRCYQDNAQSLQTVINQHFQKDGKRIAGDAMAFLRENLGNDRAITQQELEKLSVFVGSDDEVTLDHCLETISSAPSISVFKLCDAIGMRDRKAVDTYLSMLKEEGQDSTMILAMVLRHLRRLMQASEMMNQGMNADQAMSTLKPPVFFGKPDFAAQLRKYPLKRLRSTSERVYKVQLESRQGVVPTELVIERGLLGFSF